MRNISNKEASEYIKQGLIKFGDKALLGVPDRFLLTIVFILILVFDSYLIYLGITLVNDLFGAIGCLLIVALPIWLLVALGINLYKGQLVLLSPEYFILGGRGARLYVPVSEMQLFNATADQNGKPISLILSVGHREIELNLETHLFKDKHGETMAPTYVISSVMNIISNPIESE